MALLAAMGCWQRMEGGDRERREALLYAGLAAGITLPLFAGFLKWLGMMTSTWYYLPPLAIAAGALDSAASTLRDVPRWRWLPTAFLVLVVGLTVPGAWPGLRERVTNADLVAAEIGQLAATEDLVVVQPWPCGVSFNPITTGLPNGRPYPRSKSIPSIASI